jgi:hypothetical protein
MAHESYKNSPNSESKSELKRVKSILFKDLKNEFKIENAHEALSDWNLDDLYLLSKKIYQNVGGWTGFKESNWNYYPESFMYYFVDPYTMWIWSINRVKYNKKEFELIVSRSRYTICRHIFDNLNDEEKLKNMLKRNLKFVTDTKQLNILSEYCFEKFENHISWLTNKYSVVDLIKGRVYRMLRERTVERIKPESGIECVICMERNEEFRFHPLGYRFHTICGFCLDNLKKLECPYCKVELLGPLMKK